jgi:hypothetical protein
MACADQRLFVSRSFDVLRGLAAQPGEEPLGESASMPVRRQSVATPGELRTHSCPSLVRARRWKIATAGALKFGFMAPDTCDVVLRAWRP